MHSIPLAEAKENLDDWVRRAIAGEEIAIETDGRVVVLRPIPPHRFAKQSPLEALRWLQKNPTLTDEQASAYCEEIRLHRASWKR
jgi:antitoxin (DNA-binding transcriptional repressor) of toxin-antitoxin stability system